MAGMLVQQPQEPILVTIIEEPVRETTVVDVLIGAIGLTGALLLAAVLLGAVFGGLFILYRQYSARRAPYDGRPGADVPHIT